MKVYIKSTSIFNILRHPVPFNEEYSIYQRQVLNMLLDEGLYKKHFPLQLTSVYQILEGVKIYQFLIYLFFYSLNHKFNNCSQNKQGISGLQEEKYLESV